MERLSGLVDELLTLARADAGTAPAGNVDVVALAAGRLDAWRPVADGSRLLLEAPPDLHARVGRDRITQVLDNLVANALRHAPGTTVTVRVVRTGRLVELRVADEGPGLSDEEKRRAFDRFWRTGSGRGGSGLGLAIARRLVEIDGGTIELLDAAGGGLEAVVRVPSV